jgi:hypothetical protein
LKRVYLLGNGLSLKDIPVEFLRDVQTMGVNKIGAHFTPDYYVKVDMTVFAGENTWKDEVLPMVGAGIPCLLWDKFRDGEPDPNAAFGDSIPEGIGDQPNVRWVPRCEHHGIGPGQKGCSTAWHSPICTAYNSISAMAQWAEELGFEEIILLGCDLNFSDGILDHFMPYYKQVDSGYVERNNINAVAAHELIKKSCKIPVYNATPGGALTVWPRIDLHEMLRNR